MLITNITSPATMPVPGIDIGIKNGTASTMQVSNPPLLPISSRKSLRVTSSLVIFLGIPDIIFE